MRTIHALALAAVAATGFAGTALADDVTHVTPPLYREHARGIQQVRPAHELTTTPQPVAARTAPRVVTVARTN